MATTIELYNLDKYSAYIPAPKIDRVEGDADEIILSADGREESASDGLPGSLTIHASGGVWIDTHHGSTCEVSSKFTIPVGSSTAETFLSFDKRSFRTALIDVIFQSGNNFTTKKLTVIHNNSAVVVQIDDSVSVPLSTTWNAQITGSVSGNNINLNVSGLADNSIVSCISKYTLT